MHIKETLYPPDERSWYIRFLCWEAYLAIGTGGVLCFSGFWESWIFAMTWLYLLAFLTPMLWLTAMSERRWFPDEVAIELHDGTLRVTYRLGRGVTFEAPLAECRWFYGGQSWTTYAASRVGQLLPFRRAMLLEMPESCRFVRAEGYARPVIVPVGRTRETRELWGRALSEHGVAEDTVKSGMLPPLSPAGISVALIGGIIAGFGFGEGVTSVVLEQLAQHGFTERVQEAALTPIYLFAFLLCLLPFVAVSHGWNVRRGVLIPRGLSAGTYAGRAFAVLMLWAVTFYTCCVVSAWGLEPQDTACRVCFLALSPVIVAVYTLVWGYAWYGGKSPENGHENGDEHDH